MAEIGVSLYHHAGGAMLRAASLPVGEEPDAWPVLAEPDSCRAWLRTAWALPGLAAATRYASSPFAGKVEDVLAQRITAGKQVRRITLSVLRYLLRCVGRPTPFGLFAGVAPVQVAGETRVVWGREHRLLIRADTLWLDDVIERLETRPELLPALTVLMSDLLVDRGERVEMPRGPGRVTVRNTALLRLVRDTAATPIRFAALAATISDAFDATPTKVHQALSCLVAQGVLITNLRAPMTVTDPLRHLIENLQGAVGEAMPADLRGMVTELADVERAVGEHNAAGVSADEQSRLRDTAVRRMRGLSGAGRTTIAGDLHLDCRVTVPAGLAEEMAYAVSALLRLTRQPRPDRRWNDWCREFWDRYGTGAVVPVTEATHPDCGIGLPAGFPASTLAEPDDTLSRRDEELLRLAWHAANDGRDEVILTDDLLAAITADQPINPHAIPPHVELGARVHATSAQALQAGQYTFTVRPAQAFGTLTSRFEPTTTRAGLHTTYRGAPAGVDGALSVQMSFPPLFPHSENVARIPAHLPHVLPLGEHRTTGDPGVIGVDDVGIVALADGLHLISISRRQLIVPQVFHALALPKQAPPLARFIATLTRGFLARYTEFEWGPPAARLPFLPRVRYRRAILSPATWHLTTADHTALATEPGTWHDAFARWRQRWNCPDTVELHDDHRSLRLTLTADPHLTVLRGHLDQHGHATLTEADPPTGTAWLGGHVHEIVMPFARTTPPAPNLATGPLPLITNTSTAHRPAAPAASWLYAQIFTHPERLDDIIATHLPNLLADLDGDPAYWFARYRSPRETDHLRLRIHTKTPNDYTATALAVGRWAEQLCTLGAASRLTLATYFPEVGRYGSGPAMDAAEAVFAADSHAAMATHQLTPRVIHPQALTAIGMVAITDGFLGNPDHATAWLLDHRTAQATATVDRAVAAHAALWATAGTLPDGTPLPPALAGSWEARHAALTRYRRALPDDTAGDRVLPALLHMHHNRTRLIDRADEAVCLRLARQIALARRAHTTGSGS